MPSVFISYRHVDPDQHLAAALVQTLSANDLDVFVDTGIEVGLRWAAEIERQIAASQFFVVLLSAESIRSDMVRREIAMAHERERDGGVGILPVRVAFEGELPYDIGAYLDPFQYAVWEDGAPFEGVCRQLEAAILGQESLPGPARDDDAEPDAAGMQRLAEATEHRGAPLPVADPRLETGTLDPGSPFYVKRAADTAIEVFVQRTGETMVIKAPRQFGKSSLMARAHALALERGMASCLVDFQLIDEARLASIDDLCRFLAHKLARAFRTTTRPEEVWDDYLGPKESLTMFMEDAVLRAGDGPVLLCLDEADRVFDRDYREDFFATVRGWHNTRAVNDVWKQLSLIIVHATTAALWIQDLNISPFNVGERLRLPPFGEPQLADLNRRHGSPLGIDADLRSVHGLLGGQPYLTRQAFYTLSSGGGSLADLERDATSETGPFGDHLRQHMICLRRDENRKKALREILRHGACGDDMDFERLSAAGLVRGESRRSASAACELYHRYFSERL